MRDLTGEKFGRLTFITPIRKSGGHTLWKVRCDCGNEKIMVDGNVVDGRAQSCGCLKNENNRNRAVEQHKGLVGKRVGKLVVVALSNEKHRRALWWICQCDCGNTTKIQTAKLNHERVFSCGCLMEESREKLGLTFKHGLTNTRTYRIWKGMRSRCLNKNYHSYQDYGARGITICAQWNDYQNFLTDMGIAPNGMSIERKNNEGHYSPDNCIWATPRQQARNTRRNIVIEFRGERKTLIEWAENCDIKYATLKQRYKAGWNIESIFTTPARKVRHALTESTP